MFDLTAPECRVALLLGLYLGLSLIALALFAYDKWAAMAGRSRIREATLLVWIAAGGFAGAGLGRLLFRHKLRKARFGWAIVLAALGHLALWWWLAQYT